MFKLKQLFIGIGVSALLSAGAAQAATIYSQDFTTATQGALAGTVGMIDLNRSTLATDQWGGGNSDVFTAQAGPDGSYFANSYLSGGTSGSISDWLLTPVLTLSNNITFSFWAREAEASSFADSLSFGVCTGAVCTAITAASTTTNAALLALFSPFKITVNPTFDAAGFPTEWTNYTGTITGLGNVSGRFAFRYFVDDVTVHGNYIGLDSISIGAVPEPESMLLMGLGLAAMGLTLRRKARK